MENLSHSSVKADGEKYLVFLSGTEFFAIASRTIAEAAAALAVTRLPNAPTWLLGIANLRGEVISVLDFPAILKQEICTAAPNPKFIVLRSDIFESGAAFAANRINEIVALSDEEIQIETNHNSPHIFGRAVYKSQTLNLIDTEKLLASLKINS